MVRIYIGNDPGARALFGSVRVPGCEFVSGEAPPGAAAADFALVPAREGITSGLRHALNNALTSVLGYAELGLRQPDLVDDLRVKLATIHEQAEKCRQLLLRAEKTA